MKRGLLAAGLVIAVVLPTALIGRVQPHMFTVPEVIRAFKANGIDLRRQPFDPRQALEELFSPRLDVDVVVYRRAKGQSGPWRLPANAQRARRANVFVAWTGRGAAVRRALRQLRRSSSPIAFAEVVLVVLRPGQSRTLTRAQVPNGAEVQCVNGYAAAQHFLRWVRFRPSASGGGTARLVWRPEPPGWRYVVSCHS